MHPPLPWHHVHLTSPDRGTSAAWYQQHLGLHRADPSKRSENLYLGPNLIQIQGEAVAVTPHSGEIENLGFGVPDPEAFVSRLVAGGATRTDTRTVLDPWGTPFEFIEADVTDIKFQGVHIGVDDPDAVAHWYAGHLGGQVTACPFDRTRLQVSYDTACLTVGERQQASAKSRPIDHLGWFCNDLTHLATSLTRSGVEFTIPPRPYGGVRLAFIRDPAGIWSELVEPPGGRILSRNPAHTPAFFTCKFL